MATGLFDDLIPTAPRTVTGAFNDLIPSVSTVPQEPRYPSASQIRLAQEQQALNAERESLPLPKAALQLALGTGEVGKGELRRGLGALIRYPGYTGLLDLIPAYRRARMQFGEDVSQLGRENVAEAEELGQELGGGTAGRLLRQLGATATVSAPAIPAAVLGGLPAAAATAGAIQYGSSVEQFADTIMARNPGLTRQEAEQRAQIPAAISGGITTALTRIIPGGTEVVFNRLMSGQLTREGLKGLVKGAVRSVAEEIPEEGLDQIGQGFTEKLLVNPDKSIQDIANETLFAMGAAGALAGTTAGGLSVIGRTAQAIARPIEQRRTRRIGIEPQDRPVIERIERPPDDTQTQREVVPPVTPEAAPTTGVLQQPQAGSEARTTGTLLPDSLRPEFPLKPGLNTPWEDQKGIPVRLVPDPDSPGRQKWERVQPLEERPPNAPQERKEQVGNIIEHPTLTSQGLQTIPGYSGGVQPGRNVSAQAQTVPATQAGLNVAPVTFLQVQEGMPELVWYRLNEDITSPDGRVYPAGKNISNGELARFGYTVPESELAKATPAVPKTVNTSLAVDTGPSVTPAFNVNEVVNAFRQRYPNAPQINVVATESELPPEILSTKPPGAQFITAAWHGMDDGTAQVWLVADRMSSPEKVSRILAHEIVGHHGLRTLMGDDFSAIYRAVERRLRNSPTWQNAVNIYGQDPDVIGQELLADLAETPDKDLNLWQQIVAAIQRWWRENINPNRLISDLEIRRALMRSRRFLQQQPAVEYREFTPEGDLITAYAAQPQNIEVDINHPKADVLARVTFTTKRDTAEHYGTYFTITKNGVPESWRVFNADVPANVRDAVVSAFSSRTSFAVEPARPWGFWVSSSGEMVPVQNFAEHELVAKQILGKEFNPEIGTAESQLYNRGYARVVGTREQMHIDSPKPLSNAARRAIKDYAIEKNLTAEFGRDTSISYGLGREVIHQAEAEESPFDRMRREAGAEPPPELTPEQQAARERNERIRGRRPETLFALESPKNTEEMDRALAVKEAEEEGWVKHRALGVDDWVLNRDQWTDDEKLRSRKQAEQTFLNAGVPVTWNEQNRYFDIQPGATVESQYRLLELVKESMRRQNWPAEPEVAALIASITANSKLGQIDYFDSYVRRQLYKLTRSEASHRGALLGALSHFAKDIREVSLRVEEILERTWADAYGGPGVEKAAEDLAKAVSEKAKDPAVAQKILDKAPELTRAGVDAGLIGQIFQMPFFTQAELKERFISAVIKKTGVTPAEAERLWKIFKEKFDPIRRELGRLALQEVKSLLRPDQRHLGKKPIWMKIQQMVDKGEFDAGNILGIIATEKGWRAPTPEEIGKLKQLAKQERDLRELNAKERAEVEKYSEVHPATPEAFEKARAEKEKKTEQHRNQILREMDTRWARFTRPISLNPVKWVGLRHNTAAAGLELIAANLLATIGFPFRLSISVASQILPHVAIRPFTYAWEQHSGTLGTLEGQKNFIRDAYLGLGDSISAYLKSVKPAAYAARAAFLGRGEQRNILRLTSSIAAFDRIRLKSKEEYEKGNIAKATALQFLGMLDIGFRSARALDAFQTLPAETAEMYHQIRLEMGKQGKPLSEIKANQQQIMDRIFREWMQAIADTRKGLADAGVTDATEAQIKEIAWTLIRQRQYAKANELGLHGDDWQRINRYNKSVWAWNEAETKGAGGIVGGILKRTQRGITQNLGIPTDIGVFSNAIATSINRQLHFTPFYHWFGGGVGEGSPWHSTELERKHRALEALAGTGFGSLVVAAVLMGLIKVQLPRRMDDDEKEKFIADGHRFGTVEFKYGDQFVPVSINNSPLWIVAPYLAGAGALVDLKERRQKEQDKLNAEAAKKGLPPGEIRPMDPGDLAGVAAQAAWQTIFGSRTFSGFLGSIANYGEQLNTRRIIAGRLAPMVPGLPAVREVVSRMGGVNLNNKMATIWDYMLPLPSSQAAMVNKLGDPVRTPNDLQRVIQVLSGGNYGPVPAQEAQAYQTLYGSEFHPPTISPNKGYQFPDSFRPMNNAELSNYAKLRGQYFKEALAGVAAGDEAAVKSAYQQAERRALSEVGVQVPIPKVTTARGTTTTRRATTIRGPRRLRSISRLRRPRLRRISYRRPRLTSTRPRLRRIRRLAA